MAITFSGNNGRIDLNEIAIPNWIAVSVDPQACRYIENWVQTHPCRIAVHQRVFTVEMSTMQVDHTLTIKCLVCESHHEAFGDDVNRFGEVAEMA